MQQMASRGCNGWQWVGAIAREVRICNDFVGVLHFEAEAKNVGIETHTAAPRFSCGWIERNDGWNERNDGLLITHHVDDVEASTARTLDRGAGAAFREMRDGPAHPSAVHRGRDGRPGDAVVAHFDEGDLARGKRRSGLALASARWEAEPCIAATTTRLKGAG